MVSQQEVLVNLIEPNSRQIHHLVVSINQIAHAALTPA
jgi:hypothetical protein